MSQQEHHVSFEGEDSASSDGMIESLSLLLGMMEPEICVDSHADEPDHYFLRLRNQHGRLDVWLGTADEARNLAEKIHNHLPESDFNTEDVIFEAFGFKLVRGVE
jgi:hypothetical protein